MATARKDENQSVNPEGLPSDADAPGNAEMQKRVDKAEEQGFLGVETDPTPNENYTVQGVTSGAATPETDVDAADKALAYQRELGGKGNGPGPR